MALAEEAGIPKGVLSLVTGNSAMIGEVFCSHRVKKLSFTGSTEVGRVLFRQCAGMVKKRGDGAGRQGARRRHAQRLQGAAQRARHPSLGLAARAVELSPTAGAPCKRTYDIFIDCFKHGVLVRPAADNIVICPPYIVEKGHIDRIVNVVADAIRKNA